MQRQALVFVRDVSGHRGACAVQSRPYVAAPVPIDKELHFLAILATNASGPALRNDVAMSRPQGAAAATSGTALEGMICARERFGPAATSARYGDLPETTETYPDLAGVSCGTPARYGYVFGFFWGQPYLAGVIRGRPSKGGGLWRPRPGHRFAMSLHRAIRDRAVVAQFRMHQSCSHAPPSAR